MGEYISENFRTFIWIFILIALWEGVWKVIALWKAARNKQMAWFVVLAVLNTAGILPIIYILWLQKKK